GEGREVDRHDGRASRGGAMSSPYLASCALCGRAALTDEFISVQGVPFCNRAESCTDDRKRRAERQLANALPLVGSFGECLHRDRGPVAGAPTESMCLRCGEYIPVVPTRGR